MYLHPRDRSKVLKVYREFKTPEHMRARRWYYRFVPLFFFEHNARDIRQYRRFKRKAPHLLHLVAPTFGYAETNLGRALVAEHVRNPDGKTCDTLRAYLTREGLKGLREITPVLDDLFEQFAANHITVRDSKSQNYLVRCKDNGLGLVIVDGLGDSTIPYKSLSIRLNRVRLMRRKAKLLVRLREIAAA